MFRFVFNLLFCLMPWQAGSPASQSPEPQVLGSQPPEGGTGRSASLEERDLYLQAATQIAAGTPQAAIGPLQALLRQFPNSELSHIVLPHLVECYLATNRPGDALRILEDSSQEDWQAAPERVALLASHACHGLPSTREAAERIERYLASRSKETDWPNSPLRQTLDELIGRYERLQDYSAAIGCLRLDVTPGQPRHLQQKFRLQLAWAYDQRRQNQVARAIELLQELKSMQLTETQLSAVLFELAEAQLANNQIAEALEQLVALAELANSLAAKTQQPPEWAASVALRRGEMLVMHRRYDEAKPLLVQAQLDYNHFPMRYEFDFLLARCAIANIEFEEALGYLRAVAEIPTADSAAIARSIWMQGEIYLLQREYSQALECYQRVAHMPDYTEWQLRGLLQAGKCYEVLGKPLRAYAAYAQIQLACRSDACHPWATEIRRQAHERQTMLNSANATHR